MLRQFIFMMRKFFLFFFSETQKSDDTLECDSLIGLLDVCFDRLEDSLDNLGF